MSSACAPLNCRVGKTKPELGKPPSCWPFCSSPPVCGRSSTPKPGRSASRQLKLRDRRACRWRWWSGLPRTLGAVLILVPAVPALGRDPSSEFLPELRSWAISPSITAHYAAPIAVASPGIKRGWGPQFFLGGPGRCLGLAWWREMWVRDRRAVCAPWW